MRGAGEDPAAGVREGGQSGANYARSGELKLLSHLIDHARSNPFLPSHDFWSNPARESWGIEVYADLSSSEFMLWQKYESDIQCKIMELNDVSITGKMN